MSHVTSQLTFDEANGLAQQLIKANYVVELKQNNEKWTVVVIAMRTTISSSNNTKVFT